MLEGGWILVGSASGHALYAHCRGRTAPSSASTRPKPPSRRRPDPRRPAVFADTGGNTYCYDIGGDLVWKHDGSAPAAGGPAVSDDGSLVVVTNVDDLAVALSGETGALEWQYRAKRDLTRARPSCRCMPRRRPTSSATRCCSASATARSSRSICAAARRSGSAPSARAAIPTSSPDPVTRDGDVYTSGYYEPLVAIDLESHNVRWRLDAGSANAPLRCPPRASARRR
ncbi:MAG: PQQ-binding-like beta-propeller repeat protein [Myxococcota bacterium]